MWGLNYCIIAIIVADILHFTSVSFQANTKWSKWHHCPSMYEWYCIVIVTHLHFYEVFYTTTVTLKGSGVRNDTANFLLIHSLTFDKIGKIRNGLIPQGVLSLMITSCMPSISYTDTLTTPCLALIQPLCHF